jgi:hypothetical protein
MPLFNVTYEIWDEGAFEIGETDDKGFISKDVSLSDAISDVLGTSSRRFVGYNVEPNCSEVNDARWFSVDHGSDIVTGDHETRALHIPDSVTSASRRRIARLLGVNVP